MLSANLRAAFKRSLKRICFLLMICVTGCNDTPSEDALQASLQALQETIEMRDATGMDQLLADDFVGPNGLDREAAQRLAAVQWMRYNKVRVVIGPPTLEIRHDNATAKFTTGLSGGAGFLPETGEIYDVTTGWRYANGKWRMTSAIWKPKP